MGHFCGNSIYTSEYWNQITLLLDFWAISIRYGCELEHGGGSGGEGGMVERSTLKLPNTWDNQREEEEKTHKHFL